MEEDIYIVDNPGIVKCLCCGQSELSSDILPTELGCVSQLGHALVQHRVSNNQANYP